MLYRITILAALMLMSSLGAAAQTSETENSPRQRLAFMSELTGDWVIYSRRMTEQGWVEAEPEPATVESLWDGQAYRQTETTDFGNASYELVTHLTWDQYRSVYRITALDEGWGIMDVYEGGFDQNGDLVVTNLRSDTYFPWGPDQRAHFQLRWAFDDHAEGFVFHVLLTLDGGASWMPYFENTYRRA